MHPLFQKAERSRQASNFKAAQKTYRTLLHRSLPPSEKAEALLGLADVERIQGHFLSAMDHYRQATQLFQKIHPPLVVDAEVGWALAARAMGQPRPALVGLRKALIFYRRDKDPQGEAFVHWALGGTFRIAGRMKEGLKELKKAQHLYQKLGDREGKAYVCCALGGIYRMLGRYEESGKFYGEANRRMRTRGDTFGTAYSYCGLGNVERMAGRFRAALPFYRKAERLYGRIGDRVSYAYTLWSLGTTYKMLGRYREAHWAFYKADNLFRKTGDTRGKIYTLLGFAEVEWLKGHRPKGNRWWKRAKTIADRSDYAWEGLHVGALRDGKVSPMKDRYLQAGSKFYPKALPINWP